MKTTELINLIASIIILISSLFLLFKHYGDKKSSLNESISDLEFNLGKIALIVMSMGTIWTITKIQVMPKSQVLLNLGLSLFMVWLCIRLDKIYYLKKDEKNSRKVDPKGEDFPEEPG